MSVLEVPRGKQAEAPDGEPTRLAQLVFSTYLTQCERISLGDLPISADLYEHSPGAPCILFIPGIGTYSEYYCEFLAKLSGQGFNVLSVDLRGHGYSGGARGYYKIHEAVADLQLGLAYLSQRYSQPIGVLGCSIGSRLGLALAEADQRVRSLLCQTLFLSECPPDLWHQLGWYSLAYTSFWMPDVKTDIRNFIDIEALLQGYSLGQYALTDQRMVWSYPVSTLDSVYSAPSKVLQQDIGIPAALLIGENDTVIQPEYARELVRRTVHPFEWIEIAGGGHMLPLDDIDRMVNESQRWFARTL